MPCPPKMGCCDSFCRAAVYARCGCGAGVDAMLGMNEDEKFGGPGEKGEAPVGLGGCCWAGKRRRGSPPYMNSALESDFMDQFWP
jgi:hypothetical protein